MKSLHQLRATVPFFVFSMCLSYLGVVILLMFLHLRARSVAVIWKQCKIILISLVVWHPRRSMSPVITLRRAMIYLAQIFMVFELMNADSMSWFEAHFCEAVIIERLPIGVFADPFELQSLVQRQVYLDAAVFGDTNLELPSALSNQSVFEVHMEIEHGNYSKSLEIVIELPLHARYPPLDPIGYSRVEIGPPDLFMRCRPRLLNEGTFWWMVAHLDDAAGSHHNVTWLIPCGHKGHTGFVSTVTFVSALASSLLIVFSAFSYSKRDYIKGP